MQLPEPEKDENQQGPAAADEVSGKEDEKPDFGQSDSSDADPNQGAINLGFDIKDEASKEETEEEEVCIFVSFLWSLSTQSGLYFVLGP